MDSTLKKDSSKKLKEEVTDVEAIPSSPDQISHSKIQQIFEES